MQRYTCLFLVSFFACKAAVSADFSIKQQGAPIKAGNFRLIEASPSHLVMDCLLSLGWEPASDEMKDEDVWQIAVSYAQHPQFINMSGKKKPKLDTLSEQNIMWQSDMTWLFIAPHPVDDSTKHYSISGYKIWHINTDQQISIKMADAFCSSLRKHSIEVPKKATPDRQ